MPKRLVPVVCLVVSLVASLLAIAACGTDTPTNGSSSSSDGGTDATSAVEASAPDATADAGPQGCQPCVVGTSTIGNCCLQ